MPESTLYSLFLPESGLPRCLNKIHLSHHTFSSLSLSLPPRRRPPYSHPRLVSPTPPSSNPSSSICYPFSQRVSIHGQTTQSML